MTARSQVIVEPTFPKLTLPRLFLNEAILPAGKVGVLKPCGFRTPVSTNLRQAESATSLVVFGKVSGTSRGVMQGYPYIYIYIRIF